MSETTEGAAEEVGTAAPPPQPDAGAEERARMMGWKPKDQYRGPPDKWVPADEFLDRGFASPAVLADRVEVMTSRMTRMERDNQTLSSKFDDAVRTINDMTTMMRAADKRAYDRARADLDQQRVKAVEAGDTEAFRRLDTEMRELDRGAPPANVAAANPNVSSTSAPQGRSTPTADNPAVQAFYQRNPWYSRDPVMTQEADIIHTGLLNARPDLTVDQNLAEVERRLRAQFPDRFGAAPPTRGMNGGYQQQQPQQPENPRRNEAGSVSPASSSGSPRQQQGRRTFAAMPQASKDAYTRYKRMLEGHGEPLTEAEWATDYWSQFEDGEA